jgi:hypothetical protein
MIACCLLKTYRRSEFFLKPHDFRLKKASFARFRVKYFGKITYNFRIIFLNLFADVHVSGKYCLADLLQFWKAAAGGHLSAPFRNLFMDYK